MATLLIIDDDISIREALQELFCDRHECHTADRAEQALQFLEFETYDVVVTDLSMPGLGGLQVLKSLTEQHPTTPVIVISGHVHAEKEMMLGMGAFAFFPKPFLLDDLEEAVRRAIAHRNEMKVGFPTEHPGTH